jgi:iron uptake system component EfeO
LNSPRALTSFALACLAVTSAACGSSSSAGSGSGSDGAGKSVAVTLSDAGCSPANVTIPAGAVTFNVSNSGSGKVTELELLNEQGVILGERENVVEGIPGSFSLKLQPGSYKLSCPNGDTTPEGTLKVTGDHLAAATGASAKLLTTATAGYKSYVNSETAKLQTGTARFVAALKAGDLQKAKDLFGPVRRHYEAIEPVAESFGDLDPEIDARVNDVADPSKWTGFHRIEKILWVGDTTHGTRPYATKLMNDVNTLAAKAAKLSYQPAQLANGSVELLNEVAGSKITGEEDRYSHTDLSDFQGNLTGAYVAFKLLRPALAETGNGTLATTISQRFAAVQKSLDSYKRATPLGYAPYGELTRADRLKLSQEVDALAEPLSMVASKVTG